MSDKMEKAIKLHSKGYNCAQSVACVFAEELGKSEKDVYEIMEAFGFGMGCMGTCGAVSAMTAVVGMSESDGNLENPGATKKASYKVIKGLINDFTEKNTSVICKEIKGVDTGVVLRSCPGCIEDAVELLEKYFSAKS